MRELFLIAALAAPAAAYDEIRFPPPIPLKEAAQPVAAVSSGNRFYVLDSKKNAVLFYDAQGVFLKAAGRAGSGADGLSAPKGLALGPDGNVYVADTGNSRVQILDSDGNFVRSFGTRGSSPGQLRYPEGVAVGEDGRVYVADTGNDRVEVFTQEGICLFSLGPRFVSGHKETKETKAETEKKDAKAEKNSEIVDTISNPSHVAVDAADFIFVFDSGRGRVLKFDPRAGFAKAIKLQGQDFALDAYGFLYALDLSARKVREYNPDGNFLGAFGNKGSGQGQFKDPAGISAVPSGGLVVVDRELKRLLRVELTSKLKVQPVAPSLAGKLLVVGPARTWPFSATALAAGGDLLYAYLPKEGQFVELIPDGKTGRRFGRKSGRDPSVTRGSQGLAVSPEQGVFVADTDGDKLQHFTAAGEFVSNFAAAEGFFDSKSKEGRVSSPRGVAVSDKGTVFVADAGNRRVEAFSADGSLLFAFGPSVGPHALKEPVAVAWDPEGFVYILDRGLRKIFKCEPSGGFVLAWGEEGSGAGQLEDPTAMVYDGRRYLYVLDRRARHVAVFDRDGTWVTDFFAPGSDDRSLQDPAALAVWKDELFVSDPGQGRVRAFALHPRLAPPPDVSAEAVEGVVELKWKSAADAWVSRYRVLRSSFPEGPFEPLGQTKLPAFKDETVAAQHTYHYRVATEANTGDVGALSAPVTVFVPGASNRPPLEIASVDIGNIFSANYKFYHRNPVGKLVLVNNANLPFENVKVSFRLKDFMDFSTDTSLPRVGPQERVEIALQALLNNRILEVTEDTPIQAEFSLTYFQDGKPQTVSLDKPLRVYSRNAITWDRPERIATFITSNDTPVKDFERRVMADAVAPPAAQVFGADEPIVKAARVWHALGAAGLKYQPAPNNPFEKMSVDPAFPEDYTQFPRETLKSKSGQCDDLATLLASLFEAAGVKAALLDYPGHIAMMFDLGVNDPLEAGMSQNQLIAYDGTYWVPLEPTLVGAALPEAHRYAVNAYREMDKQGKARVIDPRKAWTAFEPATMPPTDWAAPAPAPEEVSKRVEADLAHYAKERYDFLGGVYRQRSAQDPKDSDSIVELGNLEIEMNRPERAAREFERALAVDPGQAAALNNLGSVAFMQKDFAKAQAWFLKAAEQEPSDAGIWLNLAKTAVKLKDAAKAGEYGRKAVALEPELETAVQALMQ